MPATPVQDLPPRERERGFIELFSRYPAQLQRALLISIGGITATTRWTAYAHISQVPTGQGSYAIGVGTSSA